MNMKQYVVGVVCAAVVATAGYAAPVSAQSTNQAAMLAQIEQLMKLIAELQEKLKTAQGDLEELIKDGLVEGMTDEDIKKVQELLATDPTIYPGGLVTGYFGPMTREAIRRFQERMDLEVTGTLNKETREAIKELRKERINGRIPPGLLQSEAVRARVRAKLAEKWGECDYNRPVRAALCDKIKDGRDDDNDDDDDEDEDEDEDEEDRDIDRNDARSAIEDAADAIEDLEEEIEEAEEDGVDEEALEDAEEALDEARKNLADARRAYAARNHELAYTKAELAEETAEEAKEALEEADDDDDDDEDDDDDDEENS